MENLFYKIILFLAFAVRSSFHILTILLLFYQSKSVAQTDATREIAKIVYLDSIVVQASRDEFSVADFIDMVQKDASFYLAFRNLRAAAYDFTTEMKFLDRKDKQRATYKAKHRQKINEGCRYQVTLDEFITGDLFKRKRRKENYYTYTLYDRLFLTHDTICGISVIPQEINFDGRGMEGHVGELKKLIFSPGTKSDVPFIGAKTEIFSEKMMQHYDFFIRSTPYNNMTEAYAFEVKLKDEYDQRNNNKTVVKQLTTFFSKADFQVLGRSYQLAHYKALYSFDVTMQIDLCRKNGLYFPVQIFYDGFWNVPIKRKETSSFTITFDRHESKNH